MRLCLQAAKERTNVDSTAAKQPAYFMDLAVLATRRNRLFGNAAFLEETRKAISQDQNERVRRITTTST
jgi:hypothetical protein